MESVKPLIMPEVLKPETLAGFSASERRDYLKRVILMILEANRNRKSGVLMQELVEHLPFKRNQIERAIQDLLQQREIYALEHYKRFQYFINGRVDHKIVGDEFDTKDRRYIFKVIANSRRRVELFIQEKALSFFGEEHNNGAILIPFQDLDGFIEKLETLKAESEEVVLKLMEGNSRVIQ